MRSFPAILFSVLRLSLFAQLLRRRAWLGGMAAVGYARLTRRAPGKRHGGGTAVPLRHRKTPLRGCAG
ncbi:hypothetical protein [Streptomyces roseoverticillatus]|uniref:hypothetical protein n=1 Tax=Streptomyces roseoverticillatus TaxID=66429 RepID=UPI0004C02988|nr:hypothetical protein [Streptomyces roseoverticillatus]